MVRRTQKARDQALSDLVEARYEVSSEHRRPRVIAWDHSYDNHLPNYIDRTVVKQAPYLNFPYLHRVTEQQTTVLLDATDANGQWMIPQPMTPGHQDAVEVVTQFLENTYRHKTANLFRNNRSQYKTWGNMGLKYGNCSMYAEWHEPSGNVRWISLDPYDEYWDARHGRYVIVRRIVTLSQLQTIAESISAPMIEEGVGMDGQPVQIDRGPRDGGRAIKAFRRVQRAVKDGIDLGYVYRAHDSVHGNSRRFRTDRIAGDGDHDPTEPSPRDDPFNAPICILEYYETDPNGMIAKVIPSFVENGDALVLQSEQNPYGVCPIIPFVPRRVDKEVYGLGNGEITGKIAEAMNWAMRAELAILGSHGWPPILYNRHSNFRKQFLKSMYGVSFKVRDIRSDLGWMPPIPTTGIHELSRTNLQRAADFGLGQTDQQRGQVGGASSATEAAIAETAGNISDRGLFREWRDSNEQLALVSLEIARVHMRRSQMIPHFGRNTGQFYELKPEFLRDIQWAVSFGGSTRGSNAAQQTAFILNMLQTAPQHHDVSEVLRHAYHINGHRNADRFLIEKEVIPAVPPDEELQNLLLTGAMPIISPRENLMLHAQVHKQQLMRLAQVLGQDHPHFLTLELHQQDTEGLAIQQMQAQVQPQGGGGTSPFQPQQAGGNGQPASFQPSTAGMNAQRQASNQQAAGAAPGGLAPGRRVGQMATGSRAQ